MNGGREIVLLVRSWFLTYALILQDESVQCVEQRSRGIIYFDAVMQYLHDGRMPVTFHYNLNGTRASFP